MRQFQILNTFTFLQFIIMIFKELSLKDIVKLHQVSDSFFKIPTKNFEKYLTKKFSTHLTIQIFKERNKKN